MTPEPGIFSSTNLLSKWSTDIKCLQSCYLESTASCFQNLYIKTHRKLQTNIIVVINPHWVSILCAKHLRQMRLEIFFCWCSDIKSQGVHITCPNRSQRWQMLDKNSAQVSHSLSLFSRLLHILLPSIKALSKQHRSSKWGFTLSTGLEKTLCRADIPDKS